MKKLLNLRMALITAIALGISLFGTMVLVQNGGQSLVTGIARAETQVHAPDPSVAVLRAISIPYGISSVLTMTQDGSELMTSGHAVCWEEGQMFDLRVRVAQSSTHAFAVGRTVDICADGERQTWRATAPLGDTEAFEPGPARVRRSAGDGQARHCR